MKKRSITVRLPENAIVDMKAKAQEAEISFTKFIERAGTLATAKDVAQPVKFQSKLNPRKV